MAIRKYKIMINYTVTDIETAEKQLCIGYKTITTYLNKNSAEFKELINTAIDDFIFEMDESLCDVEEVKFNNFTIVEV